MSIDIAATLRNIIRPTPKQALQHHVTGAIERGEAEPIVEQRGDTRYFAFLDTEDVVFLGRFNTIGDAMDADPHGNSLWVFNEDSLRCFAQRIDAALKGA